MSIARRLAASLFVLCTPAAAAWAQPIGVSSRGPADGVDVPAAGAALVDEATAPEVNPAGLAKLHALQLLYLHERNLRLDANLDSVFVAGKPGDELGFGVGVQWVRTRGAPDYRKTSLALSIGGEALSLGATLNLFASNDSESVDDLSTFDLGLQYQPTSFLAIGAAVRELAGSELRGAELPRRFDLGVGVRPFGDRLTLGADLLVDDRRGLREARFGGAAQWEPLDGLRLLAGIGQGQLDRELLLQFGLALDGPRFGLAAVGGLGTDEGSRMQRLVQVRLSRERYRGVQPPRARYVLVDLRKTLHPDRSGLAQLFGGHREPYLELLTTLGAMREDDELDGLVLKIDGLDGVGQARVHELREAVLALRKAGKRVVALFMDGGDAEYLLASAAERIYTLPESTFLVNGLTASTIFFGQALDKLGVDVDVARVGPYKTSPDQLTRSGMSPEEREQLGGYLDDVFSAYVGAVAEGRKLAPEKLREVLDRGILGGRAAKEAGLADEVIHADELPKILQDFQGGGVHLATEYPGPFDYPRRWGPTPKIAVIHVEGLITEGKSRSNPFGADIVGSETVVEALERAWRDPGTRAVVVRVESGGGSASAGATMWRALRKVGEKKPVVVSMGDIAASAGYEIAVAGHEIVAMPSTLTGSIGVFAAKPSFGPLLARLGVNREVLTRGKQADLLSVTHPWSEAERASMQRYIDEAYEEFAARVAEGRKVPRARVDEIGRGRIWSGARAKQLGLVDGLGGLLDAIDRAKARAGLTGKRVDVQVLDGREGKIELPTQPSALAEFKPMFRELSTPLGAALLEMPEMPLALMPWDIEVE